MQQMEGSRSELMATVHLGRSEGVKSMSLIIDHMILPQPRRTSLTIRGGERIARQAGADLVTECVKIVM